MYIRKVQLDNVKNIQHLKMEFHEGHEAGWHVILGDNGSGKSSILRAISYGLLGPLSGRSLNLAVREWIRRGTEKAEIWVEMHRHTVDNVYGKGYGKKWGEFWAGVSIKPSNGESVNVEPIHDNPGLVDATLWSGAKGWFSTGFGPFRRFFGGDQEMHRVYYSDPNAAAHVSLFWENVALRESLIWLRELHVRRLEAPEGNEQWVLQRFEAFINESNLLPQNTTIKKVTSDGVSFTDGNGAEVHVSNLSDGLRSMLSMTFELIRQLIRVYGAENVFSNWEKGVLTIDLPGVVLIDEVDVHLHYNWQSRIGEWFTKFFPRIQFIVTTHSPVICRAAEHGTIWALPTPGENELFRQVVGEEKNRLVYGNILDAIATGLFGDEADRSQKSKELLEEFAKLETRALVGNISKEQEDRLNTLKGMHLI